MYLIVNQELRLTDSESSVGNPYVFGAVNKLHSYSREQHFFEFHTQPSFRRPECCGIAGNYRVY